jgi:ankyrin repeat protein
MMYVKHACLIACALSSVWAADVSAGRELSPIQNPAGRRKKKRNLSPGKENGAGDDRAGAGSSLSAPSERARSSGFARRAKSRKQIFRQQRQRRRQEHAEDVSGLAAASSQPSDQEDLGVPVDRPDVCMDPIDPSIEAASLRRDAWPVQVPQASSSNAGSSRALFKKGSKRRKNQSRLDEINATRRKRQRASKEAGFSYAEPLAFGKDSALHLAALAGDAKEIDRLCFIETMDPNIRTFVGKTPLDYVFQQIPVSADCVFVLYQHGANFDKTLVSAQRRFNDLVLAGNSATVKVMLEHVSAQEGKENWVDVEYRTHGSMSLASLPIYVPSPADGFTAFQIAMLENDHEMVHVLCEFGNAKMLAPGGPSTLSPLHHAVDLLQDKMVLSLVQAMNKRGIGIHKWREPGNSDTPLHFLLRKKLSLFDFSTAGYKKIAEVLIENTDIAYINEVDYWGNSYLSVAAKGNDERSVDLLLKKAGWLTDHQNDLGQTPLHHAVQNQNIAITKNLLTHGASIIIPAKEPNTDTALHIAIRHGSIELLELLLDFQPPGVDALCMTTVFGFWPLHLAVQHGQAQMVEHLVDACAMSLDVQDESPERLTPLLEAGRTGNFRIAKILLSKGANPAIMSTTGETFLHQIARHNPANSIELLNLILPKLKTDDLNRVSTERSPVRRMPSEERDTPTVARLGSQNGSESDEEEEDSESDDEGDEEMDESESGSVARSDGSENDEEGTLIERAGEDESSSEDEDGSDSEEDSDSDSEEEEIAEDAHAAHEIDGVDEDEVDEEEEEDESVDDPICADCGLRLSQHEGSRKTKTIDEFTNASARK